jgi:hypothetical protein
MAFCAKRSTCSAGRTGLEVESFSVLVLNSGGNFHRRRTEPASGLK